MYVMLCHDVAKHCALHRGELMAARRESFYPLSGSNVSFCYSYPKNLHSTIYHILTFLYTPPMARYICSNVLSTFNKSAKINIIDMMYLTEKRRQTLLCLPPLL